jgi:four helix bundle protein
MATSLEELRVLREAESVADAVWKEVVGWDPFARKVVGGQLARAADSIGANIAEAFGRFHYGEKLQFLYYARGSLFETKYWLNRTMARALIASDQVQDHATRLTDLARQLNSFAQSLKDQRRASHKRSSAVRETTPEYTSDSPQSPLFSETELEWLETVPNL